MKEKKKIVRYFYLPSCPECFSLVEKLKKVFADSTIFHFETFDLVQGQLESSFDWFEAEKELFKTRDGVGEKPLLYGKLFFEGEEIRGFPPSPKSLKEKFLQYELKWDEKIYSFEYSTPPVTEFYSHDEEKFFVRSYTSQVFPDVCRLCTLSHPYLDSVKYEETIWGPFERKKEEFLLKASAEGFVLGEVVYYEEQAVGFIEAYLLPVAAQMGFPVSSLSQRGLMITCLSLANHVRGHGLAKKLIIALEEEAVSKGFTTIEVLTFPDTHYWQPRTMYEKAGYKSVKVIDTLALLKKEL